MQNIEIKLPQLNKGNCLLFTTLFKLKYPKAKVIVCWNKKSNIVSFSAVLHGKRYFYKRKDRKQSKFWFNGHVVPMEHK